MKGQKLISSIQLNIGAIELDLEAMESWKVKYDKWLLVKHNEDLMVMRSYLKTVMKDMQNSIKLLKECENELSLSETL